MPCFPNNITSLDVGRFVIISPTKSPHQPMSLAPLSGFLLWEPHRCSWNILRVPGVSAKFSHVTPALVSHTLCQAVGIFLDVRAVLVNVLQAHRSRRYTSLHFNSLHFTSLHFTSLHFTSLHFTSLHFTFPSIQNNTIQDITTQNTQVSFSSSCRRITSILQSSPCLQRFFHALPTMLFAKQLATAMKAVCTCYSTNSRSCTPRFTFVTVGASSRSMSSVVIFVTCAAAHSNIISDYLMFPTKNDFVFFDHC